MHYSNQGMLWLIGCLSRVFLLPFGPHLSPGFEEVARALLKRPRVLIFDEAVSSLDRATAEHFAHTVNKLKGKVTMLFITHQLPEALQVDEIVHFGLPEAGAKTSQGTN